MKTIKIKESDLADLIEGVVLETVAKHKKQWIAEQELKNKALIESKVRRFAAKLIK